MAANNPFKDHSSGNQGRKRNGPQNPTSNLEYEADLNCIHFYPIVEGILTLVVVQNVIPHQLCLFNEKNEYIENTHFCAHEEQTQRIIDHIQGKNFSELIRYLQGDFRNKELQNNIQTLDIIIERVFLVVKNLFFSQMPLTTENRSIPLSKSLGRRELEGLSTELNPARVISSGVSRSPVYYNPSLPEAKKDSPGSGSAPKSDETKRSNPIKR